MATLRETLQLRAPAAAVWDAVRDVGELHRRLVPGFVTEARLEGNARLLTFANGLTAREEIVSGKPQQGSAEDIPTGENKEDARSDQPGTRPEPGLTAVDLEQFRLLQQVQRVEFSPMPGPTLPPKGP